MGRSRYQTVEGHDTYFVTCTVVKWLPLFTKPEMAETILNSLRYLHEQDRLALHAYVIIENHIHFIATTDRFSDELRNFKSFTVKRILRLFKLSGSSFYLDLMRFSKKTHKTDQTYQVWQEGSHPIAMTDEKVLRQKIEYIHFNPVRRGYVDQPEDWRYSSARDYSGNLSFWIDCPVLEP